MKRTPIRHVSAKRARENRKRTEVLRTLYGTPCAARLDVCTGRAEQGHEVLSRARGGSIVDPANIIGVCQACHRHITEHPLEATERGLLRHGWGA